MTNITTHQDFVEALVEYLYIYGMVTHTHTHTHTHTTHMYNLSSHAVL